MNKVVRQLVAVPFVEQLRTTEHAIDGEPGNGNSGIVPPFLGGDPIPGLDDTPVILPFPRIPDFPPDELPPAA